jgi:hypothetical protein
MKLKWSKKMQRSLDKMMKDLQKTKQLLQQKTGAVNS